ncbi:MAG TPA: LPXTG cell wall anchor domain-containing protein [candidate division Zixibacteria bacterium]|nr:LPXTG cell wall anchor domain-containing protein [candidate division Zixibacteria bacterium]
MKRPITTLPLVAALLLALPLPVLAASEAEDLAAAEAGTAAFQDVAAAEAAGYALPPEGPLHECIAAMDGSGAMGLHWINGELAGDTVLDAASPEALVYERGADGALQLVAVEYVVFAAAWDAANDGPPTLFEREFMFTPEPNHFELPAFYALHAWIWKDNPSGTFAPFNPEVSCAAGSHGTPDTALPAPSGLPALGWIGALLVGSGVLVARRRRR